MADRFDEVTGKLAKIGIQQIPVVGLVVQVAEAFLPPNADRRLKDAIESDLQDTMLRLQRRVEKLAEELETQGQKLDELGAVHTAALARDLAQATTEARSTDKREVLITAVALQFDPRMGSQASRAYWLSRLRQLSDIDVVLVRLIAERGRLGFVESRVFINEQEVFDMSPADALALYSAAMRLILETPDARILKSDTFRIPTSEHVTTGPKYELTPYGAQLARFVTGRP